jgi:hypothetical protein
MISSPTGSYAGYSFAVPSNITKKIIEDLKYGEITRMKRTDILKCQFAILETSHYRGDGSCLCNDPDHREFMIKNWGYSADDFKPEE